MGSGPLGACGPLGEGGQLSKGGLLGEVGLLGEKLPQNLVKYSHILSMLLLSRQKSEIFVKSTYIIHHVKALGM